jgi:aspartyl-tRNA(Asn)/glutamyl-tRNA(Gln) amidotransferase subunit B
MDYKKYMVGDYFPTIGIECHVQLKTNTKLFVSVSNDAKEAEPNTLISHVCFGLPGALPVLNQSAIDLATRAAFALGTVPQKFSKFDRKHYFYPDLPLGYQITQFDEPIILGGAIEVVLEDGTRRNVAITRAHLEADAGKSTHPSGTDYSLVDLNRAGTPLLEIVSEPDMHSAKEAKAFAKELWLRMKTAGVSDVDLYQGNMRFDVNVSVSKDVNVLGTRSETKNLNSFRSVERAVNYEIKRQISLLDKGESIAQETRGWLDDSQKTVSQRSKEDAHDYRYFPDPDLPPVLLDDAYIDAIKKDIPIMPHEWRTKLDALGIDHSQSEMLLEAQAEFDASYLGLVTSQGSETAKVYVNWLANIEIPARRQDPEMTVDNEVRSKMFAAVYALVSGDKINSNSAKALLEEVLRGNGDIDVNKLAESKGFVQESDAGAIEAIVDEVISAHPGPVADIQKGEMKAIGFLVGQIMQQSQGKANPAMAQKIIRKKLGV